MLSEEAVRGRWSSRVGLLVTHGELNKYCKCIEDPGSQASHCQ